MKILIAPNPFKGTFSSLQAAHLIARGLKRVWPEAECDLLPLADGGPGTLDALQVALGGQRMRVMVRGPWGRSVNAPWLKVGSHLGVIESARAIGLALRQSQNEDPRDASSWGLGQLMLAARKEGCRELWIGLGGSATTDAGLGMMQAIGSLEAMRGVRIRVLCDVDNPLYGPRGAAYVYAPQKGATVSQVKQLDGRLRYAAVLMPPGVPEVPGAGAAGGLGAGFMAWTGAFLVPGAKTLLKRCGFERRMARADWIVSGEGRLDEQSLHGKLPFVVAQRALRAGKRCLLVCGSVQKGLRLKGIEVLELKGLVTPILLRARLGQAK